MKYLGMFNGWKLSPECWNLFIFRPFHVEKNQAWISIKILGLVFFFGR